MLIGEYEPSHDASSVSWRCAANGLPWIRVLRAGAAAATSAADGSAARSPIAGCRGRVHGFFRCAGVVFDSQRGATSPDAHERREGSASGGRAFASAADSGAAICAVHVSERAALRVGVGSVVSRGAVGVPFHIRLDLDSRRRNAHRHRWRPLYLSLHAPIWLDLVRLSVGMGTLPLRFVGHAPCPLASGLGRPPSHRRSPRATATPPLMRSDAHWAI
jgi:hypothetical protein